MSEQILLLVDDDENILRSLIRLFQAEDYIVLTAHSGKEALEIASKNPCKVVISDYRMPEMDGNEFLQKIREISPQSIRIMLTGYADVNISAAAINKGHVYKFMTKPWDDEFFKIMVRRAFEHYDLLQQKDALSNEIIKKNWLLNDMNKNLENLVTERTQQLLHSEKMAALGHMAGQIGHEINNILAILKGRLEMAMNKTDDGEVMQRTLKIFARQFDRLEVHTRNLLTLGKPVPSDFKKINLIDVVDNTLRTLMETGILKYYTLNKDYQEGLPSIYGDASQIDQVLVNLLINAHHAMEDSGTLSITIRNQSNNNFVEVSIQDTGSGIPEENLSRIFEPFFTTKPVGKGTGLGLAVVKKIIDEHKGHIRVMSRVNAGTTVIMDFPVAAAHVN